MVCGLGLLTTWWEALFLLFCDPVCSPCCDLLLKQLWNPPKVLRMPKCYALSFVWFSSRLFQASGSPLSGEVPFAPPWPHPQLPLLQMLLNTALNRVLMETALFLFPPFLLYFSLRGPQRLSQKKVQVRSPMLFPVVFLQQCPAEFKHSWPAFGWAISLKILRSL